MKMTMAERTRSLFQEPFAALRRMGVGEGLRVADLGSGEGYFTIPAAMIVGGRGLVYSVEPDPKRSDRIRERVSGERLENVRVLTTRAEELAEIPSGDVDLAFAAFSFHHFDDRGRALAEIRRILRDEGQFYLWDRVPGRLFGWGTRPNELGKIADGFSNFESLGSSKTVRARFTK